MSHPSNQTYRAFLISRQQMLVQDIAWAMSAQPALQAQVPATDLTRWAEDMVSLSVGVLAQADATWQASHLSPFVQRLTQASLPLPSLVEVVSIGRQQLVRHSLPVLHQLTDGVDGMQVVLRACDATTAALTQSYTMQATHAVGRLRESEDRFNAFIQAVGNVIMVIGLDYRLLEWNQEAERVYGWSRDEVLDQNYLELFIPESVRELVKQDIQKVLGGEPTRGFENPVVARDGTVRMLIWNVTRLLASTGQPIGVIATGQDITEYKQVRERLEQNEAQFQAILDNSPLSIFAKDLEGRFILSNRWFDNFFKLSKEEILGKTDYDLLPPEAADANRRNDRDVLEAGTAIEREEHIPGADGMHIYWSVKFPLYDTQGIAYAVCGIASDITALKRAEAERVAAHAQIIEAQSAALRELSTPLMPIANHVVALPLVGSVDSARAQQVLETLLEGVATHQAAIAILDITGVPVVDTQVANVLIQAAQAVRLLGARIVLTGISPAMAQTLVHLGVDLSGIITRGSLQNGIAYAMQEAASA